MDQPSTITPEQRADLVRRAREKCFVLYEGKQVKHRSCGIALAETFNLPSRPYQALRRGGITGEGQCGAVKAGELILGELFGDPEPTGAVTPVLRQAMVKYQQEITRRLDRGGAPDILCNSLTRRFASFVSEERLGYCTSIAALVAEVLAEVILDHGGTFEITALPKE
jgi:hypothetical protein